MVDLGTGRSQKGAGMKFSLSTCAALLLLSGTSEAQQRYGAWAVTETDYGHIASTTNDSGATLSKVCFNEDQQCLWAVEVANDCDDGTQTPAIVTSAAGGYHITMHCSNNKSGKVNVVSPYDAMQAAIAVNGMVGFAFPLQDGQYRVVRFSLSGSTSAAAAVERAVVREAKESTRDLSL